MLWECFQTTTGMGRQGLAPRLQGQSLQVLSICNLQRLLKYTILGWKLWLLFISSLLSQYDSISHLPRVFITVTERYDSGILWAEENDWREKKRMTIGSNLTIYMVSIHTAYYPITPWQFHRIYTFSALGYGSHHFSLWACAVDDIIVGAQLCDRTPISSGFSER